MITSGDIEFEPPQAKIYPLTRSIVMLIAGDSAAQIEIRNRTQKAITERLARDASWMGVDDAANLVSQNGIAFIRDRAVRTVLSPFGLSFDDFIKRQQEMRPAFFERLMRAMGECRPDNQTIVAGVDNSGAHIYEIDAWGARRQLDLPLSDN